MSCGSYAHWSASAITPRTSANTSSIWSTERTSVTRRSTMSNASCATDVPATRSLQLPDAIRASVEYDRLVSTNRRLLNFAGFIACVALLGYAYYTQYVLNL